MFLKPKHIAWLACMCICLLLGSVFWIKIRALTPSSTVLSDVVSGKIESKFFSSGTLAYRKQARLSAELVARVTQIHVREGQSVREGQALIQLDDSSVRAEIAQADAQLARSKIEVKRLRRDLDNKTTEWRRTSDLMGRGMITKQAAEMAMLALDNAQFQLEAGQEAELQEGAVLMQRQKMLAKTVIRSPIDGVVISIPIKVGETAVASAMSMAGSDLMVVADPGSMLVRALISEFDIGRVRVGQMTVMTTRAAPNQAYAGRVVRVARSMSAETRGGSDNGDIRTVPVDIELAAPPPDLIAGMSCDLSFSEAGQDSALLIPLSAVRFDDEALSMVSLAFGAKRNYFVWHAVDGRAVKRAVTLGFADEHQQEVRRGLKLGDRVVSGPALLLDGLREGDALSAESTRRSQ